MARFPLGLLRPGRARRPKNPDGTMTLVEHLYELRSRLTIALIAIAVTTIVGYIWFGVGLGAFPSLGDLLKEPYCSIDASYRGTVSTDGTCSFLATGPFDPFNLRLKVALTAGIVLACPIWFYELWAFVVPGLYPRERKYALSFVSVAAVLFVAGAVLAYFVVTQGLSFLLSISAGVQTTVLTGEQYFGFVIALLLIFGVSFEIPLLVVMLNLAGVVSYDRLKRSRRGLIFGLFVFAAVATPGQDPVSMLALAAALVMLFEIAIQIARRTDSRRARKRTAEGWDSWDPDAPSPIDTAPSEIDTTPSSIEPSSIEPGRGGPSTIDAPAADPAPTTDDVT